MSRRVKATPRRANCGRGPSGRRGNKGSSDSGFNNYVQGHLHNLLDDWEEEMVLQQLTGKRARIRSNNYWNMKNMLAQVLMQPHRKILVHNPPPPPALETNHFSPPSPSLVSKPMEGHENEANKECLVALDRTNMASTNYSKRKKLDNSEPTNLNPFRKSIPLPVKMTLQNYSSS